MHRADVTLYFMRHGETDWNLSQRYQGQRDIPLNATGRTQARHNGRTLAARLGGAASSFDYVASPLRRSTETMEIVRQELDLAPHGYRTDLRLREINYGHWEGQLWNDLPATDPSGFAAREADKWHWRPFGGESYADLSARVASWFAELEHDTVVTAHGGVMRVLRGLVLRLDADAIFRLDVPQDRVLVVRPAEASWL